jgi:hypothetical protein
MIRMTMICINRMLSGVLKFSQRTPVDEAGGLGCGVGTVPVCKPAPALRISQTPPTKIRISRKYGK